MSMRILLSLVLVLGAASVSAQAPHLAYAYPAGGQRGTSFEIRVGGDGLAGAEQAVFAGDGVRADVIEVVRPLQSELKEQIRDELRHLDEKRREAGKPAPSSSPPASRPQWTESDRLRAEQLRQQIAEDDRLRSIPALSDRVTLRVTVAADATVGNHELRIAASRGLSNPLVFVVGDLPEVVKPYRHVAMPLSAGGGAPLPPQARAEALSAVLPVSLPAVLNGQMMPGAVDRFRFSAHRAQVLIASARTRALIPYLSDTVPGWAQAKLSLFDSSGRELASSDHDGFRQEALLVQKIPHDGDYLLCVEDVLNRGREDFGYRVELGELPFIRSVFPPGGKRGEKTLFTLDGWNLAQPTFSFSSPETGIQILPVGIQQGLVNPLAIESSDLPEFVLNSASAKPPLVKLPLSINGRLAKPGAVARFKFRVQAGQQIVAEVIARRLGSPLDSQLTLSDSHSRVLARNDDFVDATDGLLTQQADSRISFSFPEAGIYQLALNDALHSGGRDYVYRLRLSSPRPDFDAFVLPASMQLKAGQNASFELRLIRRDGFDGPVALRLIDPDSALKLSPLTIPAGVSSQKLTLSAAAGARAGIHRLGIVAESPGLHHAVRFADEQIQAFSSKSLVPAQVGMVWVRPADKR